MRTRYAIAALALCACGASSAFAQDADVPTIERMRMGPMVAGTYNMHDGAFNTYDGILECAVFDKANSLQWLAGYLFDIPLSSSVGLSPRLYYWKANGEFVTPNPNQVRVAIDEQTVVPLQTEHRLETSLDYIGLDVLARWSFASPLYLAIGPTVGLATRAAYEQEETIVSPSGITFANGESARKIIAGNFDEQGTLSTRRELRIAATAALGVDIPLSPRVIVSPEVGFAYGFTNVLTSFDWKVNMVRAGVALTYALGDESRDTTIIAAAAPDVQAPTPVLAFDVQGRRADGTTQPYAEIVLVEEVVSDLIPLLPYVFFDAKSSDLAARYRGISSDLVSTFSEEQLTDSTIGVYHDLLNIIGSRLTRYSDATITIQGCREPLDDVGSSDALSSARASTVKEYLTGIWNIAPSRIRVTARVLPEEASNRAIEDGREENRRAEISSNDPRVVAPISRRFTTRSIDPVAVAIMPAIQHGESIASWDLGLVADNATPMYTTRGQGAPNAAMLWNLDRDAVGRAFENRPGGRINASLEAVTTDGQRLGAQRTVPVRRIVSSRRLNGQEVRDSIIERYSLIFFDFDTPRVSDFNTQVIGTIQQRMKTSSSVTVTGLTDRIGDEAHNAELARKRAQSVANAIRSRIVPERMGTVGAGENLIYDNELPEGRMYNRTVIVEIATPSEL
ncbi:MAG: OmpA family protein [bacterium]|nr:OmpA family protein [Candidatus Kapabacteria bacterium]